MSIYFSAAIWKYASSTHAWCVFIVLWQSMLSPICLDGKVPTYKYVRTLPLGMCGSLQWNRREDGKCLKCLVFYIAFIHWLAFETNASFLSK